jgi:ABC-type antimicrobial peptide transport system permease subunit
VVRLIVGQGMRAPMLGLTIGVAAALALTRLIAGLLFGTSPADPVTFTGVAFVLGAAALCACLIPARRAAAMPPMDALRQD